MNPPTLPISGTVPDLWGIFIPKLAVGLTEVLHPQLVTAGLSIVVSPSQHTAGLWREGTLTLPRVVWKSLEEAVGSCLDVG